MAVSSCAPRAFVEAMESRTLLSATVPWLAEPAVLPTTAPAAATAQPAATAVRPLGGVIRKQDSSTNDHAYVDLVKSSLGFKNATGGTAKTDANGWPTEDFVVPLWTSTAVPAGRYNMSFVGSSRTTISPAPKPAAGKPAIKVTKLSHNATTKLNTYAVDVPKGISNFTLSFRSTQGRVRDLKVLQPGNALSTTRVFTSRYLNFLKSFGPDTIRNLDISDINNNTTSAWAERPKLTDATWTRAGIPWEALVKLANNVGSNLWACVPARATDDYVRNLAKLIKSQLNPGLKVYVEYGNELWAQKFGQGSWNLAQAQAELAAGGSDLNYDGETDPFKLADRRAIRRLKQISDIFERVWTDAGLPSPINDRVRVVVGGKAFRPTHVDHLLQYIDDRYNAPSQDFWSVGLATYWQMGVYRDTQLPDGTWTTFDEHITVDQVFEGMEQDLQHYIVDGVFTEHLAHASAWGLGIDCYEIGVDTRGPFNLAAKKAATLDPRMGDFVKRFVNIFHDQGGGLANWYALGARSFDTMYGTWSITNSIYELNQPKAQAFRELRGLPPKV